ncbi:hypothetical protein [Streptomyces minutiscleroticus]|uniref:Uncharacterized protein n=1 Tax=Streptomyces minutiscleroticus TaxID=68238 RepID=A0A918NW61_9ACTN|nr:hypothetical protein [Streptomyces minutiscleroticus]GGY01704.1 hypothetical protein GCM10010358_64560 [Streptomyces minutiscleroticus]
MPPGESGADLRRGLEALTTFKKRVDGLLKTLEGSAGSPTKVEAQRISRASFSGPGTFHEASGLYAQYNNVHERLVSLSKTLGLQIESMRIAVHGADIGFDNLEEEQRRRFWQIQTRVDRDHREYTQEQREREAAERGQDGKTEEKRTDDTTAGY